MNNLNFRNPRRNQACAGFTLVEILVATAVLAILASLAVVVSSLAIKKAREAKEVSAMRQLLVAFHAHNAETGKLVSMFDTSPVFRPDGSRVPSFMAYRYPMRLGPYLDWGFVGTVLVNNAEARSKDLYRLSVFPSFGYNSAFLGGDSSLRIKDFMVTPDLGERDLAPVAFVSARHDDYSNYETMEVAGNDQREGNFRVLPSFRWGSGEFAEEGNADQWGFVDFRHQGRAVAGFLDGRVESLTEAELRDEALWSGVVN